MQNGKSIGIAPLKSENREGQMEKMKELQLAANKVIFKLCDTPIFPALASISLNKLKEYGVELAALEVRNDRQQQRREELLTQLRGICQKLIPLKSYVLMDSDTKDAQRIINYEVSRWAKARQGRVASDDIIPMMKWNKFIYDNLCPHLPQLNLKNFRSAQEEMFLTLSERYSF